VKIKIIAPNRSKKFAEATNEAVQTFVSQETKFEVESLEYGTFSLECAFDASLNAPNILKIVEKAEKDDFDGVLISCMVDPALKGSREKVSIPVVGPSRISMYVAAELAQSFSVVTEMKHLIPTMENKAIELGVKQKLVSVRSVDIQVVGSSDPDKLRSSVKTASLKAIKEDGAHGVVIGCTAMLGLGEELSNFLEKKGYSVPVIDPLGTSIKYLEMLIRLKLSQSKISYMNPPEKKRNIYKKLFNL